MLITLKGMKGRRKAPMVSAFRNIGKQLKEDNENEKIEAQQCPALFIKAPCPIQSLASKM